MTAPSSKMPLVPSSERFPCRFPSILKLIDELSLSGGDSSWSCEIDGPRVGVVGDDIEREEPVLLLFRLRVTILSLPKRGGDARGGLGEGFRLDELEPTEDMDVAEPVLT
eukprot:CAMPEP_0194562446 /NCGR_PEP_ID=MMETSP0292-20121207/2894_1 /TAXON_ID=39354 /ORGANISM="Heterosigma akashiwo, Strain CCMP2393" /LENGTH=109 /DNA_ID=CAMNT_0039411169 /DNA_START=914 /DNA_END=1243 /DNA_ORIENTATION=-